MNAGRRFDDELGVVTEAVLFLGDLDHEAIGARIDDATHYEPTPVEEAERLLDASPLAPEDATFVDLGSGLGRMVLLAARRPFRAVIGVEISPALHEIARENLALATDPQRRCADVRLASGDAAEMRFPPGDLVIYLYNPFNGAVLASALARAVASRRRGDRLVVAYHTPLYDEVVARAGLVLRVDLAFGRIYASVDPLATETTRP